MPDRPSANLLLDQLFGAEIVTIADRSLRDQTLQNTFEKAAAEGRHPYLVTYGGSSPTGALGYAFAVKEFLDQGIHADWIVFGTSSGGTHAGLVLGQRVFGYEGKILGISIDEPELGLHPAAIALIAELARSVSHRCQVLFATQSTQFLDQFEPSEVVVVEREAGATRLERPDQAELAAWLTEYSLSEVFDKGLLGGRP